PDGTKLASGSWDSMVKVWDVATQQELFTLEGHEGTVTSVAFSPDGTKLASGSWDKTVKVWDVAAQQELFTLEGHEGTVTSVAFSPDGSKLVSGSDDKTVKVWQVRPYCPHVAAQFSLKQLRAAGVQLTAADLKKVEEGK
ncbi:MAG: hypothetical protein EPO28_15585, partial [Saprospiraceae bacterium]